MNGVPETWRQGNQVQRHKLVCTLTPLPNGQVNFCWQHRCGHALISTGKAAKSTGCEGAAAAQRCRGSTAMAEVGMAPLLQASSLLGSQAGAPWQTSPPPQARMHTDTLHRFQDAHAKCCFSQDFYYFLFIKPLRSACCLPVGRISELLQPTQLDFLRHEKVY